MVDALGLERIEAAIEAFANGSPMHFEIDVAEGVWFDFDCPFASDLLDPTIPVAVGIKSWSPHNIGEPEEFQLMDYSEFGDELVCDLDEAFYNGGSRNEEIVFEYSPTNSDPENGHYLFLGSIDNPRVRFDPILNQPEINEEYV